MQNLNCRLHFSVKYTLQELTIAHLWLSLSCVCKKILSFSCLLMVCCLLLHGLSRLAPGIGLNHSTLSSLLDLKSTISRLRFVCTRCWELTQHSMQTFQCEHCLKIEDNLPELDDLFSLQLSFCIFEVMKFSSGQSCSLSHMKTERGESWQREISRVSKICVTSIPKSTENFFKNNSIQ